MVLATSLVYPNMEEVGFTRSNDLYLKVWWPYATLFEFIYLYTIHTFIHHSYVNIHTSTFAEALLHNFTAVGSVGGTSLGCRAEIRTRACLTASQRATS
jgi:hypothetical protein